MQARSLYLLEEHMKRFSLLTVALALALVFAATAMAAPSPGLKAKVSTFDFLIDYSGSMMLKHKELKGLKFDLAKTVLAKVNDRIPELGYSGSIRYFAPDKEILGQRPYNKGEFGAAVASLKSAFDVFAKFTPMGDGIEYWSNKLYGSLARPTAVILVGDGENNVGYDPLAAAQDALRANPGLCFHVISLADSPAGQATLDSITALQPSCSVSVKAADLLASDAAVEQFVYEVFLGRGVVLRSVQFAFDSSALTRESTPVLDEVAKLINQSKVEISGHTCSVGSEEYNQRLSERRAAAVKAYLVKKGVSAANITTRGYGESQPKFDNSTEEGRRLNRRAEIDFR
jgi:OOP family OmpA-OmpF porin